MFNFNKGNSSIINKFKLIIIKRKKELINNNLNNVSVLY